MSRTRAHTHTHDTRHTHTRHTAHTHTHPAHAHITRQGLDADSSGSITVDELLTGLNGVQGGGLAKADIEALIKHIDVDANGACVPCAVCVCVLCAVRRVCSPCVDALIKHIDVDANGACVPCAVCRVYVACVCV